MFKPVNFIKTDIISDMLRCADRKVLDNVVNQNYLKKAEPTKLLSELQAMELQARLNITSLADAFQKTGGVITEITPSDKIGTQWFKNI